MAFRSPGKFSNVRKANMPYSFPNTSSEGVFATLNGVQIPPSQGVWKPRVEQINLDEVSNGPHLQGEPETIINKIMYQWLFQVDASKSFYVKKWLEITKDLFKNNCFLGFQAHMVSQTLPFFQLKIKPFVRKTTNEPR